MMNFFLVLNPGSHAGRSRKRFGRIRALLSEAGIAFDYAETVTLEDARILSREANLKGYDAVIAVGGDGTINGVINGFFDEYGKRISKARFGVIYTGTSPDFCKSYNIPLELEKAVERLVDPVVVAIPVGRISMRGALTGEQGSGPEIVRYFGCCANIGLGAELARRANGGIRKIAGDFAGTLISLVITLFRFRPSTFARIVDGQEERVFRMYNTSVGLTPYIASGIRVARAAGKAGNQFYCMTVSGLKFKNILPLLNRVYSGKDHPDTDYHRITWCSQVSFEANGLNPEIEFDGDPAGFLPCKISLADDKLELIT